VSQTTAKRPLTTLQKNTNKSVIVRLKNDVEYKGKIVNVDSYERQANGKGKMVNRGQKKIQNIKYTPDFVSDSFIIECKGRANESFPIRWKMFKNYVKEHLKHVILYKPQNQKDCDEVIKLILNKTKSNED